VPAALYPATTGELAFAFRRTVSRLIEMQSADYLVQPHGFAGLPAVDAAAAPS
jgi:predicted ATPase